MVQSKKKQAISQSPLYVGSFITSVVTALLLFLEDFAGTYSYYSYGELWEYIGFSLSSPLGFLVFGLAGLSMLYAAGISLLKLTSLPLPGPFVWLAGLASLGVATASFIGAAIFIISALLTNPTDWWLGPAFFAGLIGAGLTAILLGLAPK